MAREFRLESYAVSEFAAGVESTSCPSCVEQREYDPTSTTTTTPILAVEGDAEVEDDDVVPIKASINEDSSCIGFYSSGQDQGWYRVCWPWHYWIMLMMFVIGCLGACAVGCAVLAFYKDQGAVARATVQ